VKIKAQLSLETTCKVPQALFYNVDRTWQWMGPVPGKWKPIFDANGPRLFAAVSWDTMRRPPKFVALLGELGW
jgi:hypothetical protein